MLFKKARMQMTNAVGKQERSFLKTKRHDREQLKNHETSPYGCVIFLSLWRLLLQCWSHCGTNTVLHLCGL